MKYALATSYDNYYRDLTHWAIVIHDDNTHTAYPFETAGELHAAIISGTLETMWPDDDRFSALIEQQEAGATVFPNDDIAQRPHLPEQFPYLIHHTTEN